MDAHELLAEVRRLATARLKAAAMAAKHERLSLVDGERLSLLEALVEKLTIAVSNARMTRDYKDALLPDDHYNGKRFLLRRDEFGEVIRFLNAIGKTPSAPMGWSVND